MGRRREALTWAKAKALARTLSPAGSWRERLAATLLEVPGVASTWVFTCPPGFTLGARGVVLPNATARAIADLFLKRMLPLVERERLSTGMVRRFKTRPYAAFDVLDDVLAERGRRALLAPIGASDAVHAFLVIEGDRVVGWLTLCTRISAAAFLERAGADLGDVSRLVSQSLAKALRLAEDCGAQAPRVPSLPTRRALSERETQVAELVGRGLSDLNIAHRLRISDHTVASHLRNIFGKLELHSRAELAAQAPLLRGPEFRRRLRNQR